ncbi:hypothetical protein ACSBR1_034635 [Camellia fascicularis]
MHETGASAEDARDHIKHLISEAWKKLNEVRLVNFPFNRIFVEIATNLAREVAESVKQDFGSIDILVHSLANGPEVCKPLSETSRNGYLAAISASSYSFISLLRHFLPRMNPGGASISLTYIASKRIIPGYGGGMSSAKAALESDTKVLPFEAGKSTKSESTQYLPEVGDTAAFLASPLASAITGAVVYVDNGLNAMGVGVDSQVFADLNIPKGN